MLYEQYYRKTLKWAAVLAAIKRFRVLIICVACVIVAALAAFMGVYGMVYSSSDCPSEIVYGETLDYEAKSLFSSVTYEYSPAGENAWSSVFPEFAGDYEVRSVSTSIFGTKRYGSVYAFTILPKETTVTCASYTTYGDDPALSADLASGDTIECTSFTYGDITVGSTTVEADEEGIVITNSNGTVVTSNYVITTVRSDISINQRSIEITIGDAEKVYDGKELASLEYQITDGSLAYSDGVTITGGGTITNVGKEVNSADIEIFDENGGNVTYCYNIKIVSGTLTVTKRTLYVTSGGGEWTYDGEDHYTTSFTLTAGDGETGLSDGHNIAATDYTTVCSAGEYENILGFCIYDAGGSDVTANYDIVLQAGTLTINKRQITVATGNYTRVYDGAAFSNNSYTVTAGTIADGQAAEVVSCASITDAGSCENEVVLSIYGGQSEVTANYDITYEYGTLTVTVREVTLVTEGCAWIYDGTEHSYYSYGYAASTAYQLAEGHWLDIQQGSSITNVGTVNNTFSEYNVRDAYGNAVTSNYSISFSSYGTLEVTARDITFITLSGELEYNGEEQGYAYFEVSSQAGYGLADGHSAQVAAYTTLCDAGSTANSLVINIFSGEENVTTNYNISYEEGTLTITPRSVTVTAGSDSKYYDGTALTCSTVTADRLVSGHGVTATTQGSQTEAGTGVNSIVEGSVVITDASGTNMNSNYSITLGEGSLKVMPRPVTITTGSGGWIYDGEDHYNDTCAIYADSPYSLVSGHYIYVVYYTTVNWVSDSGRNIIDVEIRDSYGNNVTYNYDITYEYGTLTITPRPVILTTGSESWVYDGYDHYNTDCALSGTSTYSLLGGHYINVISYKVVNEVADSGDNVLTADVYDAGGNMVTGNYSISYEYGTLEVTKRTITIGTESDSWTYDGTAHTNTNFSYNAADLADGQYMECKTYTYITDVGSCDNEINVDIYDNGGNKVTDNYGISYNYGTLTVTSRSITIYTYSAEKVYDGTALTCEDMSVSGMISSHSITAEFSGSQTEPGISYNTIADGSVVITDASGADVTGNYGITYEYGTLTVYAGTLTITAESASKVYDGTALTYYDYTYYYVGHPDYDENNIVADVTVAGSQTDVGTSANVITSYTITDTYGNEVPSYYYYVVTVDGTLTVTKRPVTILTGTESWVYDGEDHSDDSYVVTEGSFVSGHVLYATACTTISYVGSVSNNFTDYYIYNGIYNSGDDVTNNYDITITCGTLTVTKRNVTICTDSESWEYDGETHQSTGYSYASGTEYTLVEGHRLVCDTYTTIINAGSCDNAVTYYVYDSSSGDVTDNYNLAVVYGTLTVTPREIVVTTGGAEKVYDGTALTCSEITADRLLEGHTITAEFSGTQTEPGESDNTIEDGSVVITDASGTDVTGNYGITYEYGTLTVYAGTLTITAGSASRVYDGTALTYNVYEFSYDGHPDYDENNIVADVTVAGSQTDVGTSANVITSYKITDTYGNEVPSYYYYVVTVDGTLTVTARPVTILTGTESWVYDGEHHSDDSYVVTEGSFVSGHVLYATACTTISYVGSVNNNFTDYEIYNGEDDVTENYDITITCGTLEVTKRNVTICTDSDSWEYDGETHQTAGYSYTSGTEYNLVDGHWLLCDTCATITNAGSLDNVVAYYVYDSSNGDVTANYNLTVEYGTLTITPREIVVTAGNAEKQYDGEALTCSDVSADRLLEGHTITAECSGSQTAPGVSSNTIVEGSVVITDASGTDMTDNYTVTSYEYGTLTVCENTLTITAGSAEKVYDGEELTCGTYSYDGLLEGHTITVTTGGSQTDAGKSSNNITSYIITDASGEEVPSYYYTVVLEAGMLTVTARPVTITTGSGGWIYDGEEHYTDEYEVSETAENSGIISGHYIELADTYPVTNAGEYENKLTFIIYDDAGNNVTENYDITYSYGTLTVTSIAITIETDSCSWLYEGLTHSYSGYSYIGTLVSGHYVAVSGYTEITDIGTLDNAIVIKIYDEYGADVTENYEITYVCGTLEVFSPLELSAGENYGYTAEIYGYYTFTAESGSITLTVSGGNTGDYTLAGGELREIELEQGDIVTITAVTDSEVTLLYSATSNGEEDQKTQLYLKPVDEEKTYDGTALVATDIVGTNGYEDIFSQLIASGYTYDVVFDGSQTEVGVSYSTINNLILYDEYGNDVTDKFEFIFEQGTLTVTQQVVVEVYLYANSKVYDGTALSYSDSDYYWKVGDNYLSYSGYDVVIEGLSDISITYYGTITDAMLSTLTITVYQDGVDVTDSVTVVIDKTSRLSIQKRCITVTAATASKEYDGTALTDEDYRISGGTLADGDYMVVVVEGTITDIGETDNIITSVIIYNAEGVDVTSSYDITTISGTLTITSD